MRGRSGEGDKAARDRVARSEDSVKGGRARRETKKWKLNKVQMPRDGNGERKAADWGENTPVRRLAWMRRGGMDRKARRLAANKVIR